MTTLTRLVASVREAANQRLRDTLYGMLGVGQRESVKEKLKTLPRVERASAKLATAFQVVFDTTSEQGRPAGEAPDR